jgi:hypothetical protein
LRQLYFEMLLSKKVANKQDMVSLYAAFDQNFSNSLVKFGKFGKDGGIGLQAGGDVAGPLMNIANVLNGFAQGTIHGANIFLASFSLYDDLMTSAQMGTDKVGGFMIQVPEDALA